ncbi:MAG: 5-bromo-4-chloroindolyl phosphate hydrolysis family protein [Anaerovoracaceae bacterium]
MDLKGFTDLGGNIGRRVNDSINSMNFDRLSEDIKREIDGAFSGSGSNEKWDGKLYQDQQNTGSNQANTKGFEDFNLYKGGATANTSVQSKKKLPGKISSIVFMIIGYGLAGVLGVGIIVMTLLSVTVSYVGNVASGIVGAIGAGLVPLFIGALVLGIIGTKKYGLLNRFNKYVDLLKGAEFCAIKDLAKKLGKTTKYICKDLEKMIQKGLFPHGHIDDQQTCFMSTDQAYHQYVLAKDSAKEAQAQAEAKAKARAESQPVHTSDELKQIISEGEAYITTIRDANEAIEDHEISNKLYKMEDVIEKIFSYVRENPDQIGQLRRFMSYYMPTTEKLVNAYKKLDQETVPGENMQKAKGEIAQTLDVINEAYTKLYDSMYEEVAMDVSSDIAVLKTLFAQEGLAGKDINGGEINE